MPFGPDDRNRRRIEIEVPEHFDLQLASAGGEVSIDAGGASELDQQSIKPVRLLGENLVLYKDKGGTYGPALEAQLAEHGTANAFLLERAHESTYRVRAFRGAAAALRGRDPD